MKALLAGLLLLVVSASQLNAMNSGRAALYYVWEISELTAADYVHEN